MPLSKSLDLVRLTPALKEEFRLADFEKQIGELRFIETLFPQPTIAFLGTFEAKKLFGDPGPKETPEFEATVRYAVDELLGIMRSFHQAPLRCPDAFFSCPETGDLLPPPGASLRIGEGHAKELELSIKDVDRLHGYLAQYQQAMHSSLKLAALQLGEAAMIESPRMKLIHAVMGLEAILLHGNERDQLRFRFALNYAVSGANYAERVARYGLARAVYDARSRIVHSADPFQTPIKVPGRPSMSPAECARQSIAMLEELVTEFWNCGDHPPYAAGDGGDEYWIRRVLDPPSR